MSPVFRTCLWHHWIFPGGEVQQDGNWVRAWNGENMLAESSFTAGALGGAPSQLEVDFHIVPTRKLKLTAMAFCTKHGLWQSDEVVVEVE